MAMVSCLQLRSFGDSFGRDFGEVPLYTLVGECWPVTLISCGLMLLGASTHQFPVRASPDGGRSLGWARGTAAPGCRLNQVNPREICRGDDRWGKLSRKQSNVAQSCERARIIAAGTMDFYFYFRNNRERSKSPRPTVCLPEASNLDRHPTCNAMKKKTQSRNAV